MIQDLRVFDVRSYGRQVLVAAADIVGAVQSAADVLREQCNEERGLLAIDEVHEIGPLRAIASSPDAEGPA